MRVRFLLALPALCLQLGCGLGGRCSPSTDVILYSVNRYDVYPDHNPFQDFNVSRGRTEWDCEGPTHVWVFDDLDYEDTWHVLAHELWHVTGIEDHLTDPTCIATVSDPDILFPCPEEVAALMNVQRVFHLRPTPDIWEATVRAADFWNDALGRETFVVH